MRPILLARILSLALLIPPSAAGAQPPAAPVPHPAAAPTQPPPRAEQAADPGEPAPEAEADSGMVAVPVPSTRLSGRVLQKDGVAGVRDVELRLTNLLDGTLHTTRSDGEGRYRIALPLGRYSLAIERRMEVYASPSHYTIPWGTPVAMDFLLLPDFEEGDRPTAPSAHALPSPRPEKERVVGTIVDMAPSARAPKRWRWSETLGFVGAALAVAIASN